MPDQDSCENLVRIWYLQVNESSVDLAWIGASADIMSLVSWARRSGDDARHWVGWSEDATPARCASRWWDEPACTRRSDWTSGNLRRLSRYPCTTESPRQRK